LSSVIFDFSFPVNAAEQYLLENDGWVPAKMLASIFGLNERLLRGEDSPIRHCAISGDKGYRHIRCATEAEIDHYYSRLRKHAIEELRHARAVRIRRRAFLQGDLFPIPA
jgi:hypothetical protein